MGKFLVFCNFCVSGFVEMLLNSNDNFLARQFWLAINGTAGEGANKRGNSSRLTQSFHFFMFEPIFSPVNALNQPI